MDSYANKINSESAQHDQILHTILISYDYITVTHIVHNLQGALLICFAKIFVVCHKNVLCAKRSSTAASVTAITIISSSLS